MTFLASNFSMQKSLFKNIFGGKLFDFKTDFQNFWDTFRTKGMLNHDNTCMRVIHSLLLKDLAYRVV